jgi:hypothetical protein
MAEPIRMCIDRVFPSHRIVRAGHRAVAENPRNAPLLRPSEPGTGRHPMRMGVPTKLLWKDRRELRVRFMDGDPKVKAKVESYAHQWSEHCGITFRFGGDADAEIRIAFKPNDGSWSWVGVEALEITDHNEPTMNFGWLTPTTDADEYSRVVLHEFGHALSCIHEHSQPAAEIPWNKEAVYAEYAKPPNRWTREEVDVNLFERYAAGDTQFTAFDKQSIMLYAIDKKLTRDGFEIGWNRVLSSTDREFIGTTYPKAASPTIRLQPGAPAIGASIGAHGEEDLYQFNVTRPAVHTVETTGPTDVVMSLLGPDDQGKVVAFDDDSGLGRNARIESALTPGIYHVRIKHYRPRGTGDYQISLKSAS